MQVLLSVIPWPGQRWLFERCKGERLIAGSHARKHPVRLHRGPHGEHGHWVLAEKVNLENENAAFPSHHMPMTEAYAKGLPHECLTYKDRYGLYMNEPESM